MFIVEGLTCDGSKVTSARFYVRAADKLEAIQKARDKPHKGGWDYYGMGRVDHIEQMTQAAVDNLMFMCQINGAATYTIIY